MSGRKARQARQGSAPAPRAGKASGRNRWLWPVVVVIVVGAIVGGVFAARGNKGPAEATRAASVGKVVSFSGTDPVTGKHVDLAAYKGKPIVVNVWGSWCEGCIAEAIDLRNFAAAHPGVQVIGIDFQDSKDGARDFYRQWAWKHPSVFDPDGQIAFSLGLQGTPTTFFLDREHRLVTQIVGATDEAGFDRGLQAALKA